MLMIFCNRCDCNRQTANQTRWKHTLNQIKRDFNHKFRSLRHAVVPGVCFVVTARVATLGRLVACLTFGLLHLSFLCWSIFTFFRAKFLQSSLFLRTLFPNTFSSTLTSRPDLPKSGRASFPSSLIATSSFRRREPLRDGGVPIRCSGESRRRNKAQHLFSSHHILDNFYKCIPCGFSVFALPGWGLILQQNPPKVLYPELLSNYSIECHCGNFPCDSVFWYRFISGRSEVQYLGKSNHANRQVHGDKVDKNKFRFNARSNAIFTLTVISLTKEDTGTYSCFLGGRKFDEGKWNSGVLLLPGGSYTEIL